MPTYEVVGPATRDRTSTDCIFEREIPSDEPGGGFSERNIGVTVSRAGHWDPGGQLGVAKSGQETSDRSEEKRYCDSWTCKLFSSTSGDDEEASANSRTNTESDDIPYRQGLFETAPCRFFLLLLTQDFINSLLSVKLMKK